MYTYLIGIDEAGRGPLAGPVAVGVACVPPLFDWNMIPRVDDSKALTPKIRTEIYNRAVELRNQKMLHFEVHMVGAAVIDEIGIVRSVSKALKTGLTRVLKVLEIEATSCEVRLDGLLHAPNVFNNQTTIIGGDGKEKIIGLASIVAKVTRDRYMERMAKQDHYASYGFENHKGYGTKTHIERIHAHGLSDLHRRSYCKSLLS